MGLAQQLAEDVITDRIDGKLQTDHEWFEEDQLNMELEGTLEVIG